MPIDSIDDNEIVEIEETLATITLTNERRTLSSNPHKTSIILSRIIDWLLYGLIFFTPIFFLPLVSEPLELGKQAFLLAGTILITILFIVRIIITGRLKVRVSLAHIGLGLIFIAWTPATIFSQYSYNSLWGINGQEYQSLLSIIVLIIIAKLAANHLSSKKIDRALSALLLSSVLTSVFGILQLFQTFVLPWQIAQTNSFNTLGSITALGGFTIIALIIAINRITRATLSPLKENKIKILATCLLLPLHIFVLALINQWQLWLALAVGLMVLVVTLNTKITESKKWKWMVLPTTLLVLSIIAIGLKTAPLILLPSQTNLSLKTSSEIAMQTIQQKPLLGVGPGNFVLAYEANRPAYLNSENKLSLWKIRFESAGSALIDIMATTGIVGTIALLLLIVLVGKSLLTYLKNQQLHQEYFTTLGIASSLVAFFVLQALTPSNISLAFTGFLLIGLIAHNTSKNIKIISRKESKLFILLASSASLLMLLVGGVGVYSYVTTRLIPDIHYRRALQESRVMGKDQQSSINKIDATISELEKATIGSTSLFENNYYLQELSQVYMAKIRTLTQNTSPDALLKIADGATSAAKRAVDISPYDSRSASNLGSIYLALSALSDGADVAAINAYKKAIALEKNHPENYLNLGKAYLVQSERINEKINHLKQQLTPENSKFVQTQSIQLTEQSSAAIKNAAQALQSAADLKPDFPEAYFYQSLASLSENNKAKTVALLDKAQGFNIDLIITQTANQQLFYYIGSAFKQLGEQSKAEDAFTLAVKSGSDHNTIMMAKGELLMIAEKKGNLTEAIALGEQLLELEPENENIKQKIELLKQEKDQLENPAPPIAAPIETPSKKK